MTTTSPDGWDPQYVADVEQALAVVADDMPAPTGSAQRAAAYPSRGRVDHHPAELAGVRWRAAVRGAVSGLRTLFAFTTVLGFAVLGASLVLDWIAPVAGTPDHERTAVPVVLALAVVAVLWVVGAAVLEVLDARRRRG